MPKDAQMITNKEAVKRSLGSSDFHIRTMGLFELWTNEFESPRSLKDKVKSFFWRETQHPQDTEDLYQETYTRVLKRVVDGPLSPEPEDYLWGVARNLKNDWLRGRARHIVEPVDLEQLDKLKNAHSTEAQALERLENHDEIKLAFRLKNETDRELALLLHLDHTPQEISLLTGWDMQKVTNRVRSVKRKLEQMRKQATKYLNTPSEWEQQLSISGQLAFGISLIDIFPHNIATDCEKTLLKDFDVKSLDQLQQEFNILLRLEDINTQEPGEVLTFTPRAAFGLALLKQTPMRYQDYVATFDRDTVKGSWQKVVVLNKKETEYPAHLSSIYYEDQSEKIMSKWHMPSLRICVHKQLSEKKIRTSLPATRNPANREKYIGLYQVYPLEELGNHNGIIYV
jgi:RNA polymerase sigma factor (sigma-70 family)